MTKIELGFILGLMVPRGIETGQAAVKGLLGEIQQKRLNDEAREKERKLEQEEIDQLHKWATDTLDRYGDLPFPCAQTQPVQVEGGNIFLRRVGGVLDLGNTPDNFSHIEIVHEHENEEGGLVTIPIIVFEGRCIKNGAGKVLGSREERDPVRRILVFLVSRYYDPRKRT